MIVKTAIEQVRTIRRELLELERGETSQKVVLRSVRRRLRAIEHQLLPPKPRRKHSASGQVRCDICSPNRCSKAK